MAKANASTTVELDQVKEWVNDPCFRGHGIKATADPKLSSRKTQKLRLQWGYFLKYIIPRINKNDIEGIASDESDDLLAIEGDPLSTNEHNHNVNRSDQSEDEQMNELNAFDVDEKANIEDENVQNESNKVVTNGDWIMHELFDEMTPTQINKAKAFINKANKKYHGYLSKRFGDRTQNMKYWNVCKFSDLNYCIELESIPDIEVIKFAKNGLPKYRNDANNLIRFKREWSHFWRVVVPIYRGFKGRSVDTPPVIPDVSDNLKRVHGVCWKYYCDGDVIWFWKHINLYQLLDAFWIQLIDNQFGCADIERVMSHFRLVSGYLSRGEHPRAKAARMFSMWNYDYLKRE
eukprot:52942_1